MTTEERLERLERELGRAKRRGSWLLVGLALGLGALALVWASAASAPRAEAQGAAGGRTIRASEFILEDERSRVRASLHMAKDGPALILWDAEGEIRAMLCVADKPVLNLCDAAGEPRAMLSVGKDGPSLALHDAAGKLRANLFATAAGQSLTLHDAAGKPRAALAVVDDVPMLALLDAAGKPIWSAP